MKRILEYQTTKGVRPFGKWLKELDARAAAKVTIAATRMRTGNFGDHKGVGGGVIECRIDFGPGYRIYFGQDGDDLVILLLGGSKKRQKDDINEAKEYWKDYKKRKAQGE